jgi:hypothetical protein
MNNYQDQSNNEPVECKRCFSALDEDLECKPCDYEADANADHITEQIPNV